MYKDILLAIDLNDEASWPKAVAAAVEFCRNEGGTLHVLTVVPDFGMSIVGQYFPGGYEQDIKTKVMAALKEFVKRHVPDGINVQHVVGEGSIYEVILNIAEKISADLIIVSAHRPDLKSYLLGPNAARVVRHANCSVMVVRD